MGLRLKFNLVLVLVFAVGLALSGAVSRHILEANARDEVVRNADLMMGAALAVRGYTNKQITPQLELQLMRTFLPQALRHGAHPVTTGDPTAELVFEPLGPEHAAVLFPVLGDARVWEHIQGSDGATEEQMRAVYARRAAGPAPLRTSGGSTTRSDSRAVPISAGSRPPCTRAAGRRSPTSLASTVADADTPGPPSRWLVEHIGVDEVWASTTPANAPSRRLLTALGFREAPPSRPLASWDPGDLTYRWDRQR